MEIQAVVFDLDDTLLKTAQVKWAHHKAVAAQYGIELTDETLAKYWGMPFDEMIGHLYNQVDTVDNMRAANRALESQFPKDILPDTAAVLGRLSRSGIVMGVVTSTNAEFAVSDLAAHGIPENTFLFIQGAEATPYHKPDGRVFEPAIARAAALGIERSGILYVGDARIDYEAATDIGINFLGVASGFVSVEQFQALGATAIARLGELTGYLGLEDE